MKTIWKYNIINKYQVLQLPIHSKILTVMSQNDNVCIWVEFDIHNKNTLVDRVFEIYGTGWDIDDESLNYIGTVIYNNTNYVWHVYERI